MTNKSAGPGARGPGRRPAAECARTRARILDRAERLFARKGYRGVSLRELARVAGVRPFTIQHHFGSKLALYQVVLSRWDPEVLRRASALVAEVRDPARLVERALDELFDFFLARRAWFALNARAALGEGLPRGVAFEDRSWVRFLEDAVRSAHLDAGGLDLRLVLITVEGILNNHVLAGPRYRLLFGCDVTDAGLRAATKAHLRSVILALLGPRGPAAGAAAVQREARCAG